MKQRSSVDTILDYSFSSGEWPDWFALRITKVTNRTNITDRNQSCRSNQFSQGPIFEEIEINTPIDAAPQYGCSLKNFNIFPPHHRALSSSVKQHNKRLWLSPEVPELWEQVKVVRLWPNRNNGNIAPTYNGTARFMHMHGFFGVSANENLQGIFRSRAYFDKNRLTVFEQIDKYNAFPSEWIEARVFGVINSRSSKAEIKSDRSRTIFYKVSHLSFLVPIFASIQQYIQLAVNQELLVVITRPEMVMQPREVAA